MNLKRIFANALARRLAYVLVALLLAWCGIGKAQAQSTEDCFSTTLSVAYCNNRSDAYSALQSRLEARKSELLATFPTANWQICIAPASLGPNGTGAYYGTVRQDNCATIPQAYLRHWLVGCPEGRTWNETTKTCDEDCGARPNRQWNPGQVGIVNGSTTCDDKCLGVIFNNDSGGGYTVSYGNGMSCEAQPFPNGCEQYQRDLGWRDSTIVAGVCLPPSQPCPAGTAKDPVTGECGDNACPAGMSLNAQGQCEPEGDNCPAGQTKAPDGSCTDGGDNCPAGFAKGADGTCKPDQDGDGEPDEDAADTFSGGDSCDTPPTCSGDVILCGQARIQWRIDCNTRKDRKVNGGACNAIPSCIGKNCDALEYASLLQQWKTACTLEKMAAGSTGVGQGGQPDWTKVDGMSQNPGDGEGEGDAPGLGETDVDGEGLDTVPIVGGGGSCPALGAVGVGALSANAAATLNNPGPAWCQYIAAIYVILVLFGTITSLTIMAKGW